MANMNIKTEKILSPSNIKRIIMLGISLRDELNSVELGLISDYDNTKTYTRGQAVYYNNYLYKCLYTTTGDFDESKWQLIGDNLSLITKQDIEAMINLSDEDIKTLQSLISTEIRLDKCFSSSDTYNRLLTVENECKKFTLEQLAKKAGVVYKVVADTTGVDSTEFLYLISNGTNGYNIYAYIDGSAVKISDTNINLDDYAKLSDLDNFVKKTDADGKYALITTVDKKAEKTDLDNHINNTDIHITANERTVWNDKIDKSSIVTSIDSTSTDDTVPSALSIYNRVGIKIYNSFSQLGLTMGSETLIDIGKTMEEKSMGLFEIINGCNSSEYPYTYGTLVVFKANENRVVFNFYPTSDTTLTGREYVASYHGSKDLLLPWKQIQTEVTNDISSTKIELNSTLFSGGSVYYEVINGICYVSIEGLTPKQTGTGMVVYDNMPIPKRYICVNLAVGNSEKMPLYPICARILGGDNKLVIHSNDNTKALYGSFSYPVAKS